MKLLLIILTVIVTSFFYFPFEFTFLRGINTKLMLAGLGIPMMIFHIIKMDRTILSKEILIASVIALVFSMIGFYSVDTNNSSDYAYATYIMSMWVWLSAAYSVCTLMARIHGKLSVPLIINYLVAVCLLQCVLALVIDFVPAVKFFVDRYFTNGITDFLNKVERLYGIGATLDVAGVRFSAVLLMIAVLLSQDETIRHKPKTVALYILCFLLISAIGNMISRTTLLGMIGGMMYLFLTTDFFSPTIKYANLKLWGTICLTLVAVFFIGVYFYQTNVQLRELLRFGFEGFFNWVEKGEWRTDSTDRLNGTMWVWPEPNDTKTWLIGKATFSDWFAVGTDIGYCRFVFYSGLLGLFTFTVFFAYLSVALAYRFARFKHLFVLFFLLLLVNWLKVSTDIFIAYAPFLAMGSPYLYEQYYSESELLA
ncbi:hypothetical protein BWD42_07285 [Sphingobacterium sp. CZ-UAM]|uniref:hypothetical protein n=1 Tax=Sphingobacterium sp. CZ-UAM TaxID=1933868 RepID=UPI0009850BD8|nr:hypothetical protein [Sphingobacterium sp. CZ-UAM]OOG19699.1 hypothetical protein BWD42_07285 [Sphingobacterium sp. CZ-UAM]